MNLFEQELKEKTGIQYVAVNSFTLKLLFYDHRNVKINIKNVDNFICKIISDLFIFKFNPGFYFIIMFKALLMAEEAILRKLVADGDGTGDDRRIVQLFQVLMNLQ